MKKISIFLLWLGGFLMGLGFHDQIIPKEKPKKPCVQYTVLDADHVINCAGDTVPYTWQLLKREP